MEKTSKKQSCEVKNLAGKTVNQFKASFSEASSIDLFRRDAGWSDKFVFF